MDAVILDLRVFERFPARATLTADPQEFSVECDGVLGVDEVTLEVTIQQAGEEYYCQGLVTGTLRLECARCLTEYAAEIRQETDFICRDRAAAVAEAGIVDDEDYAYFDGLERIVKVDDLVRQALVLAVDIKPLCREDCLGLCPKCGCNLNVEECDCRVDGVDHRWDALKKLKDNIT